MKATALLREQHDEVRAIFEKLEHGKGDAKKLVEKLATSLAGHMVIEQELFYPAVMKVKEDLVLESYEEHAVARFALKRLLRTSPKARTFQAKVKTLEDLIEHHATEEEEDLFAKAEKALGARSESLCAEMKKLFDETTKAGYEKVLGPGGPAVTSATARANAA